MIFSLDCRRRRHIYLDYFYPIDQSSAWHAHFFNIGSPRKRLNRFKRFIFVYSDNTLHNTNFITLNAAVSSYPTILPYVLRSEVWSCV